MRSHRLAFTVLAAVLLVAGICAVNIARHAYAPYGPCPPGDTVARYWWTQSSWDRAQGAGQPLPVGQPGTYTIGFGPFRWLETTSCAGSLTITGS